MGGVRDLPADKLGVDVRHDFRPTYTLLPRKGNLVRRLMRAISKADAVYVATPPDRAGEAMGWHLLALSPALREQADLSCSADCTHARCDSRSLRRPSLTRHELGRGRR